MSQEQYFPGLEGVIAGETSISSIADGLRYRGYSIEALAADSTFLEVAYLLLHGELPSQEFYADFQSLIADAAELPAPIVDLLEAIPLHVSLMDVLRTGVSALAHFDPQANEAGEDAALSQVTRLLGRIPLLIATRYRITQGVPVLQPSDGLSYPGNLLYLLTGVDPTPQQERAMDVSLILYAEHEFNASTFTGRVVTSTRSDLYSAITAAIGALKGPLHGGANERVMEVLEEVTAHGDAEAWVREALKQKRRIMGFGHRVYKDGDPRAVILKRYCQELADTVGEEKWEQMANTLETIVGQEKKLPPNLDWPSARLYHYMDLDVDLYTPLFVVSRVVGWAAHVVEQMQNNRLIRPRSRYIGESAREYIPLSQRG